MYLLLLVFGGLLGAAGVILAGSGMSLRDGTFDAAILTPGIVAAAGGLLLIGLGAGLRTLQRIERSLAARPMPRALAVPEGAQVAENIETPRQPARIPFAPKISSRCEWRNDRAAIGQKKRQWSGRLADRAPFVGEFAASERRTPKRAGLPGAVAERSASIARGR